MMQASNEILKDLICKAGLASIQKRLSIAARPSYIYGPVIHTEDALSKFGGTPRLPKDEDWPSYEGKRLDFICQVEFPFGDGESMILMLFYDLESRPFKGIDGEAAFSVRCFSSDEIKVVATSNSEFTGQVLLRRESFVLPWVSGSSVKGPIFRKMGVTGGNMGKYEDLLSLIDDIDQECSGYLVRVFQHPEYWFESSLYIGAEKERPIAYGSKEFLELAKRGSSWFPLLVIPSAKDESLIFGDMESLVVWINTSDWEMGNFGKTRISIE